ncbi:MAG: winged helix-turn-helix transcriptional regulator [Candidatus Bathyarchaeia archaeon]|jgi:predicted transcriptional regulator
MAGKSGVLTKKLLEVGIRQKLFTLISECPGIHFRDAQRRTESATGNLTYHLDCLVKAGLLTTVRDGKYLRYYACKERSIEEKVILALARRKTDRHILLLLLQNETNTNEELSKILSLSPSTISWHIKKLIETNILSVKAEGRKAFYSVNSPELVSGILIKYKESYVDKLLDRFVEMWEM